MQKPSLRERDGEITDWQTNLAGILHYRDRGIALSGKNREIAVIWTIEELTACHSKANRQKPIERDRMLYRQRHKIENMFGRLKDWRRTAC